MKAIDNVQKNMSGQSSLLKSLLGFVVITLVFIFLYSPLNLLLVNVEFNVKRNQYNNVVQWMKENKKIQGQDEKIEVVRLPNELQSLTPFGQVFVLQNYETTNIFIPHRSGFFREFTSGFWYRSDNTFPPLGTTINQVQCNSNIQIAPYWFYC